MALSLSEGTRQDTLNKLKKLSMAPFPIGYVKIASWRIVPNSSSYECVLDLYYDKATRDADPLSTVHYEIGSTIQQSDFDAMTSGDDRQLLYKQIEYIIHFQAYQQEIDDGADPIEINKELDTLASELGIQTLFKFPEESLE